MKSYPVTNNEWVLIDGNATKMGDYLQKMYNLNDFNKFNWLFFHLYNNVVPHYFVRTGVLTDKKVRGGANAIAPYNTDPWFREFPAFLSDVRKTRFVNAFTGNGVRYGYDCVYGDTVIMQNVSLSDIIKNLPVAIIHYTSVDGNQIHCIDLINSADV